MEGAEESDKRGASFEAASMAGAAREARESAARDKRWAEAEDSINEEAQRREEAIARWQRRRTRHRRPTRIPDAIDLDGSAWVVWEKWTSSAGSAGIEEVPFPMLQRWMVSDIKAKHKAAWNTYVKRWSPESFMARFGGKVEPVMQAELAEAVKNVFNMLMEEKEWEHEDDYCIRMERNERARAAASIS